MTGHSSLGPGREFDLIRRFVTILPGHDELIAGVGDDAAVLRGGLVLASDASVEDVHFRRAWLLPAEIGYRAAAVAMSDLAAMAATPVALLVSLVLPVSLYGDFATELMAGAARAAARFGAGIAGGDTSRIDGPLVIDVALLGRTERPVLRSGARTGDELWVTGQLGGAAAAVAAWREGTQPDAEARLVFAEPEPRIPEALWLATRCDLHALIDLSDGLASDAAHLAAASGVRIRLETQVLPIHASARSRPDAVRLALGGGDDYELCFAAEAGQVQPLTAAFERAFAISLTRVGTVLDGSGVEIIDEKGSFMEEPLDGYDHFRSPL